MATEKPGRAVRATRWTVVTAVVSIGYVLSSGPVLATAFWLREATHWNGFYAAIWLYAPLVVWKPDALPVRYIEWWVKLFGTVGPG